MNFEKLSNVKTRFAPSPTGYLHIGNIRAAIINYLFAKKNNGNFILRIDDTDSEKVKNEYIENIYKDLSWLNLDYEYSFKQSQQKYVYNYFIKKLIELDVIYPCFETEEELNIQRDISIKSNKPFIYNKNSCNLTIKEKEEMIKLGKKPYYRFQLSNKLISWNDMIKGNVQFNAKNLSDPVVLRSNGEIIYILASVIDDCMANITHIIRGEDHITNTAYQIQMFENIINIAKSINQQELNELETYYQLEKQNNNVNNNLSFLNFQYANLPTFGHLGLIRSKDAKISKRVGGFSVKSLREEDHINSNTLMSFLTFIGTSKNVIPYINQVNLLEEFGIDFYSSSSTSYSQNDIILLNKKMMQKLEYEHIQDKYPNITLEFWQAVKMNIENENDLITYHKIISEPSLKVETDAKIILILKLLIEYIENSNSYLELSDIVDYIMNYYIKNNSKLDLEANKNLYQSIQKKDIYIAIRMSLTGQISGPEVATLLNLIKKDIIIKRLQFCIYGK
ncbi:MAG: glutamate--tRNA ligase family protein [Rickettsiales bacterium]